MSATPGKRTDLENGCYIKWWANGTKKYYNAEGKLHRLDGPAKIYASGHNSDGGYYIGGIQLNRETHAKCVAALEAALDAEGGAL
jgi:hypothetical protein